ncbi:hypothetical protein CVT25_015600 [Psilocybe cyanescens]|uniref:Uncharacterized protein n=1 Tax=Psilocybe cyanescens TaxID=93625 RepID=A0A409WHU1_PSICY|nr:hypothetical protein CVT25_015600 [Psilocybe cyanescens]
MSSLLMLIYLCISIRDIQSSRKQSRLDLVQHSSAEKRASSSLSAHTHRLSTSNNKPNVQVSKTATHASPRSSGVSPTRQGPSALPTHLSSAGTRRPKRRRWSFDIDPIEVLLKHNPSTSDGATQWGFGQILALIVVTPSALSVTDAFSRHGFRRLSRRKKRGNEMDRRSLADDIQEENELSNLMSVLINPLIGILLKLIIAVVLVSHPRN